MTKILVVEDEPKTRAYLRAGLAESGFVVEVAGTGLDGLHVALTEPIDLIVLDINLPDVSGWHMLEKLRQTKDLPVLILSARSSVDERIRGLEAGADDYLGKPFSYAELLARIRALLRRGQRKMPDELQVADLHIDVARRRVVRGAARIDLTAREYALLHLLASHAGEVLSRSYITSQVWDMNFDSDTNVVDVAIRRVRSKVDDPFAKKLVHTVRGMGYVMEERDDSEASVPH